MIKHLLPGILVLAIFFSCKSDQVKNTASTIAASYFIVADSNVSSGITGAYGNRALNLPVNCSTNFPTGTKIIVRKVEFIPTVKFMEFDVADTITTTKGGQFTTTVSASMSMEGAVHFYVLASMQDNGLKEADKILDIANDTLYSRRYTCFAADGLFPDVRKNEKDKILIPLSATGK